MSFREIFPEIFREISKIKILILVKLIILILLFDYQTAYSQVELPNAISTTISEGVTANLEFISENLSGATIKSSLTAWYSTRGFEPFWIRNGAPSSAASQILAAIKDSYQDGLSPKDYYLDAIKARWESGEVQQLAELELLLSLAAAKLASDARFGRIKLIKIDQESFPSKTSLTRNLDISFQDIISQNDVGAAISHQFPQHRQYLRMKKALAEYRAIALEGGWRNIPTDQPLKNGVTGPAVAALINRLKISGDLPISDIQAQQNTPPQFDVEVIAAVKSFQQRHGIPVTGEVHALTFAALNTPVEDRITSLILNLERWRWLERDFTEEKAVYVNIAGYELFAVNGPDIALRLPVIVGKKFAATPIFSDQIEYIEFNPYWNVPYSIAVNEIFPKLRADPNYLESQHMRIYADQKSGLHEISASSIDWRSPIGKQIGRFAIKQDPGPWNVLGKLKFAFPNIYSVFLHDTSSPNLFAQNNRAFSHGCIRVKNPIQLAVFLLNTSNDSWDSSRAEETIATEKNQIVKLPKPVRIHVIYRTAWVDLDGTVNFRADLYGRDKKLAKAIS